ncbi:MAG: sigma-70 family RNA polymerase sigma factor [Bacteroidota bacterium]
METPLKKLEKASDAALVRLFQRGSNRAFDVLVKRYQLSLKKYARKRLHNPVLEKDAIQNVWYDVLTMLQRRTYKETGHFKEWVQTLLYWRTADILKTEAHYVHDVAATGKISKTDAPDKLLFENRLKKVKESCSKLSKHLRQVVHLRVEKGMAFPLIAKVMHTSTGNVTSWYSRAIKKLRKLNRN